MWCATFIVSLVPHAHFMERVCIILLSIRLMLRTAHTMAV